MFLKRLELHGFKSFAPRTTLEFSPGITAIVGPNGSGKSNIADGIRWVLGEQSMRQLRGKRSDDVIFAGGQGRATMQMAEVGLVLDNSSAWLPSEFTEVTAARRSFRNGESEYLVNGQRVRLKDVLLLLAQARIGHDSYTVIGQGLVDQALSQRAEERRALFEDAAGIRQFQAQRNDAEQKLTLTQTNLARLRDIVGEIEPRLAPLAEQARRAREFSGAHDELRRLLHVWYRQQWRDVHTACERAEATERDFVARIQKLQDALAVEDALILEKREQHQALLTQLATVRRERGETASGLQTAERDVAVARERLASLDRQESDLGVEQEQQNDAVAVAQAHVGALEAQLERAEEQADAATAELDSLEKGLHAARQEQEREEARLRAAQRDVIQIQARLGAAQTELGRLQRQLGERNRGLAGRRETAALAQRKLEALEAQLAERKEVFDAAHAEVEELVAQREHCQRELADGQREAERLRAAVADHEREQAALKDRLALLEEWQRNLEGFSDGARALLQTTESECPPIIGALAQLITAPQGFDLAIETACGAFLQAIVVGSRQEAKRAASWLASSNGGRATFVWPEQQDSSTRDGAMPEPDGTNLFGYAGELVSCAPELRSIVQRVFGATYVVRDLSIVEARWEGSGLPVPMVTLEGELVHPRGWLRGGRGKAGGQPGGRDAGVLGRERELRRLPAAIEQMDAMIADVKAQYARQQEALGLLTSRQATLAKELKDAEARAQELAKAVTALQREQERAQNEVGLSDAVTEQLAAEIRGLEQEVNVTTARVAEQETAQQDATERVEAIQEEVDDLQSRHRGQQDELARARTAAAVQKQEVKALTQRVEQLRAQAKELQTQMARREQRLQAIRLQRDELTQTVSGHDEAIETSRERLRTLTDELRAVEQRQGELERQMHELERGQNAERQELARVEVELRRAVVESQRARENIDALKQQIREEFAEDDGSDPIETFATPSADGDEQSENGQESTLTPEEAAKLRRQIDQLRSRIKHLGGYDPDAPQLYEELKTRHDFLTSQIRDMEQASTNLLAVIHELDMTMRRQFEETFHAVNERFQRHFTSLFSGGAARLELTAPRRAVAEEDEDEESAEVRVPARGMGVGGIEVYVQIPGKRVQDLTLLSGGERAMVSAALLFALLETNPPPFCLLDEVDAALDEANVVRFCEILRVLAEQTQFIVITHNRVTMTHANAIYGISMGGDSVSRVLSMKLEEAVVAR